uniref:Uncharacterized protein n=1 Tax=Physcomitrium patens TaxID=3218 RepID=A0A2K1L7Y0_PHYPA|nr:hypothetical protein PHYPA_000579 [Physcomitrium patens]
MFELPSCPSPAVHVAGIAGSEPQCSLCQMLACPKLVHYPDPGEVLSNQCEIHSAIVFVIVDYLWQACQQ